MKKLSMFSVFLLLMIAQTIHSQETSRDVRFTIKTNPLAALGGPLYVAFVPVTGEYKVLFEVKTTSKQSIEAGLGYLGSSVILNMDELADSIDKISVSGFRVQLKYKFFITKDEAPRGFYVAPHISYAYAGISNKANSEDKITLSKLNLNVLFGYQVITKGRFALDLYSGLGIKMRDYNIPTDTDFNDLDLGNRVAPNVTLGFSFGFAF
jgi:hypothetical protein